MTRTVNARSTPAALTAPRGLWDTPGQFLLNGYCMESPLLPTVERVIGKRPDTAVIWLHGLGADGNDFEPIVDQLELPDTLSVRFVFPHAPVQAVTMNSGYQMRSWFDLYSLQLDEQIDLFGIRRSARAIDQLIAREMTRGIETSRILLAGFSQGGALALYVGLRHPARLAGIMGLSTFLPFNAALDGERSSMNAGLPIFLAHGTWDPTVNYAFALQTKHWLSASGYPVEFHDYPMPHSVCAQEIADIRTWMLSRLG